jgi:pimeloyl-ACP methyl ester carboxylesterase
VKRIAIAGVLALSTLWFNVPANAATPPALPKPQGSFAAGSLHVDVYGTPGKPSLIFIPGLTCGPWEWSGEIAHFSSNYRIYALTLPGFDGTPAIQAPLFDTVSADFWTLLQTQHIDRPEVVGHSLGGTLAILLAEQHPERLRKVIALDGLPIFPGTQLMPTAQRIAMAKQSSTALAQMSKAQFAQSQKRSMPFMVTAVADAAAIASQTAESDPAATAQWVYEDFTLDLRPQLKKATVPIVEIAPFDPAFDPLGPAALSNSSAKQQYYAALFEGAPNAGVQIISPSRHFMMYDQPAALDAALARLL